MPTVTIPTTGFEWLLPWDSHLTVVVDVERTEESLKRSYTSTFCAQYDSSTFGRGECIVRSPRLT